jgi:Na+-driven multidrug efflux pump
LDAVAIAGQAIVGRYLQAADVDGTRAATRRMVEWGVGPGIVLGVTLLALRAASVPLFTEDRAVRELLGSVLVVAAVAQPVCGVVFALDGVLIGAGRRRLPRAGRGHHVGLRLTTARAVAGPTACSPASSRPAHHGRQGAAPATPARRSG